MKQPVADSKRLLDQKQTIIIVRMLHKAVTLLFEELSVSLCRLKSGYVDHVLTIVHAETIFFLTLASLLLTIGPFIYLFFIRRTHMHQSKTGLY